MCKTIQQIFNLSGKIALITGATGHLGSEMALALAEAGANVIISSRNLRKAQEFTASLPRNINSSHYAVQMDYLDPESIESGFLKTIEHFDKIDILINNGNQMISSDLTKATAKQINEQTAIGTGYFLLSRYVYQRCVEKKIPGSIIMIGSLYGLTGSYPEVYKGLCNSSPVGYHMLKGGIIQLTRHLAVYWAKDNVRVNCISPGVFPGDEAPPDLSSRLADKCPMGRIGKPQELRGSIIFLASDASSYVTGHNLVVDGGWTAW